MSLRDFLFPIEEETEQQTTLSLPLIEAMNDAVNGMVQNLPLEENWPLDATPSASAGVLHSTIKQTVDDKPINLKTRR